MSKATLGGGCFWCVEACFTRLKGVSKAVPGYAGGSKADANYKAVCSGSTDHAEVIQVTFDPSITPFEKILQAFFTAHDPTQLNRQGNDRGRQYRSVIFYHDDNQKEVSERIIRELDSSNAYKDKIVTEIAKLDTFYPAEEYHHNYYAINGDSNSYCAFVVKPKVEKFMKVFG